MLRFKWLVLSFLAALTLFMAYQARKVSVESKTIDVFPSNHPYVETFVKYADTFGGASVVLMSVEVHEGTIFNTSTLRKVQRITRAVELLPGVNNYQVLSIAQKKVKQTELDSVTGFRSIPLMWPEVPDGAPGLEALRRRILNDPRIYGTLVSLDQKAALIVAGFFDNKLDPRLVYARLDQLIAEESDEHTSVRAIGRPVLLGQILAQSPRIGLIMLVACVSMLLVLWVYFRSLVGVVVPASAALMSAVIGFGSLGLFGYNFDPLTLVIPFIITARALSHSVQVVSQFLDEYRETRDRHQAALATSIVLFKPGTLAIVTDAAGILLVCLAPIPLLQKLALGGACWVLSIFASGMVFTPILLSIMPIAAPRLTREMSALDALLGHLGRFVTGRGRRVVFGLAALAMALGVLFASRLVVGDVYPGTPQLWPDSRYNTDTDQIARRFGNTEVLSVVVEGETRDAIKEPEVLKTMEAFQRHMETLDEVGSTSSLADLLPGVVSLFHGDDPKYELIPNEKAQSAYFLETLYSSGDPGDLARFVTIGSQNANIELNLRDHKGDTLRKVIAHAKAFIEQHPLEHVKFRLAGGYGGLLAAINETIAMLDVRVTLAAFSAVFFCCVLAFRSILAGCLFLLPLVAANYMTYALMGALGIGLDVNVLPVVALGVGLGVDYGLYIVEAIQRAYVRTGDAERAIAEGVETAGKGVLVTGATMALGLVFWRWSFLRFPADMGGLLLFWMLTSTVGSLIVLPALLAQFKPRFVFGVSSSSERRVVPAAA
jgi:uncharacterized protein